MAFSRTHGRPVISQRQNHGKIGTQPQSQDTGFCLSSSPVETEIWSQTHQARGTWPHCVLWQMCPLIPHSVPCGSLAALCCLGIATCGFTDHSRAAMNSIKSPQRPLLKLQIEPSLSIRNKSNPSLSTCRVATQCVYHRSYWSSSHLIAYTFFSDLSCKNCPRWQSQRV